MEQLEQSSTAEQPGRHRFARRLGLVFLLAAVLFVVYVAVLVVRLRTDSGSTIEPSVEHSTSFTTGALPAAVGVSGAERLERDHSPAAGPVDATVTIVEFSDFECPFCRQSFPVIRSLTNRYDTQVRHVYRHFPVASVHANAALAAEASQCAADQDRFWPFHDRLFLNQQALERSDLLRYATQSGIEVNTFTRCLDSGVHRKTIEQDLADGLALGVRGTPTWFLNGRRVEGAIPEEIFADLITDLIAQ